MCLHSQHFADVAIGNNFAVLIAKTDTGETSPIKIDLCPPIECCTEFSGNLSLDSTNCQLNWLPYTNSSYKAVLQIKTGEGFIDLVEATSPYDVSSYQNGTFRLVAKSVTCPELYSNEVVVSCNALCEINDLNLNMYVTQNDSFDVIVNLSDSLDFTLNFTLTECYPTGDINLSFNKIGLPGINAYRFPESLFWNQNHYCFKMVVEASCSSCPSNCFAIDSFIHSPVLKNINSESRYTINDKVKIYPNPFTSGFTVDIKSSSDNNALISVYDTKGQKIYYDLLPLSKGENRY